MRRSWLWPAAPWPRTGVAPPPWPRSSRRPNWLIKQTSNAHNGHASSSQPPQTQDPEQAVAAVRLCVIFKCLGCSVCGMPVTSGSFGPFCYCQLDSWMNFPQCTLCSGAGQCSFGHCHLIWLGSQLAAIWPANYLHIKSAAKEIRTFCWTCVKVFNNFVSSRLPFALHIRKIIFVAYF